MKHLTKQETVEALKELFDYENIIDGGQCRIGNITFVFTSFFIENRSV